MDRGKWPEVEKAPGIINANNYMEITELMVAADVGVTDYSSWIYDFLLLEKPGFIYAPDAEVYQEKRGLYYPLEETPFSLAKTGEEMKKNVLEFQEDEFKEKAKAFLEQKQCVETGNSCEALVENFRSKMN